MEPVVTKSGHIYSREAIVEYLLTKTVELKEARANYDKWIARHQAKLRAQQNAELKEQVEDFEDTQKAVPTSRKRAREGKEENALKRTSYWLAEFQPEWDEEVPDPPPDRPASPFSGQPLRRKDLKPIVLERSEGKVHCCLSHKTITTQPVVALFGEGHVVLEEMYDSLVKPTMLCPFSGKKLKEKHVVRLEKGKSGFASSGPVEATRYRPTIT